MQPLRTGRPARLPFIADDEVSMTPPPTWDALQAAAELLQLELRVDVRDYAFVNVHCELRTRNGSPFVRLDITDLPEADADRVMRAMVASALLQLGPGAPIDTPALEQATAALGLTPTEAGELAHLAAVLAAEAGAGG